MANAWRSFNRLPLSNRRHVPNLQNENKISPFGVHQISAASLFFISSSSSSPLLSFSFLSLSLSLLWFLHKRTMTDWKTPKPERYTNNQQGERKKGGVLAEVWKPSITEGLKLTSQQDACIRMQIWAGYGQQMPSGAVKRAPTAHERPYAMWDSGLITGLLQKNRKLNWVMTGVEDQKSLCLEWSGITGWKTRQTNEWGAVAHGSRGCSKAHASSVEQQQQQQQQRRRLRASPLQQVALSGPVDVEKKMQRDFSTNAALTGFSPLATSLYFGPSARAVPLGFLSLLIDTSLQAFLHSQNSAIVFLGPLSNSTQEGSSPPPLSSRLSRPI